MSGTGNQQSGNSTPSEEQPLPPSVVQPVLLTIAEAIKAARSSRATVYREINAGRLKTIKIGRRRYTTPAFMRDWVDTLTRQQESAE